MLTEVASPSCSVEEQVNRIAYSLWQRLTSFAVVVSAVGAGRGRANLGEMRKPPVLTPPIVGAGVCSTRYTSSEDVT